MKKVYTERTCTERSRSSRSGFTIAEVLVVMAIVAIVGLIMVQIFTNTLRGSNKSQVLSVIKQNGQSLMDTVTKTIREADNIACYVNVDGSPAVIVVVKNGIYTRFKSVFPTPGANGYIFLDHPERPPGQDLKTFINDQVACTNPPEPDAQILTDTNTKTGVSVSEAHFQESGLSGYKASVTVTVVMKPGVEAPSSLAGQIDDTTFKTTILLR